MRKINLVVLAAIALALLGAVAGGAALLASVHPSRGPAGPALLGPSPSQFPSPVRASPGASIEATAHSTVPPPGPRSTPSRAPSPPAGAGGTINLTEPSSGQSFNVHAGQRFSVVLPGDGRQYHGYTTPLSSDGAVIRQDTGLACDASAGYFCTSFVVAGAGSAQLMSSSDPACRQVTPPCGAPSREWHVTVTAT